MDECKPLDGGAVGVLLNSPSVSLLVVVEIILGYLQNLGRSLLVHSPTSAQREHLLRDTPTR